MRTSKEGTFPVAALCDRDGTVGWTNTTNLTVESIDGFTPGQILDESATSSQEEPDA